MIHPSVAILLALGLFAAGCVRGAEESRALDLSPCQFEDPARVNVVTAECGDLAVPEDPAHPQHRTLSLRVARVAAINRRKQPDPLFVLAGGPGMAATMFYASASFALERIHRDRDIVLIDQRGTGNSNALNCTLDDAALYRATDAQLQASADACLQALQKHADVRFYTTSLAVQDIDRVRKALGYRHINLYGVSYGTRVAQHYMRRFPAQTRAVILDGVVPPQNRLGPATALNAEQALTRILARCAADPGCRHQFGDPHAAYTAVRAALANRPVAVSLPDPTNGRITQFDFTGYHLATVLRLASYTAEQAALLPLMLHEAQNADFTAFAAQFLMVNRALGDAVAYGMHNSVVCSEDVPYYDLATINRAELEKTYLGTTQLDGLRAMCSAWPRGPVDADFHTPLHSDVPVLLLSGSDDPVTPVADAEQVKRGLTHSIHVIMQGFGHGQLTAPCIDRVMTEFLATGSSTDTTCTRNDRPMPFFTSLGGPSP